MSENYDLEYQSRRKCEIYRDTGVSKNLKFDLKRHNLSYALNIKCRPHLGRSLLLNL